MRARFAAAAVRRYYDRHTTTFVTYGRGGGVGALHRAVWGPGVETRAHAFRYVEDLIAEHIRGLTTRLDGVHVVDLGCGVGGSLCYLADRLPLRGTGVTLSPLQVRLAAQRIRDAGLEDRLVCLEADFCNLPPDIHAADAAYAIEAFAHASAPKRFFSECARLLRPGGLLIICDDFRRSTTEPAATRAVERFRHGWHVNTLIDRDALRALARAAGFDHESTVDLSPHLRIQRSDRVIALFAALAGRLPSVAARYGYLVGGVALQRCLARGWIGYDLSVFRRLGS